MPRLLNLFIVTLPLWAYASAADPVVRLLPGDVAPAFSAVDDRDKVWNSADHVGKSVLVVFFYPADMTNVCTKQACSFRDQYKAFKSEGVQVIGVSGDSVRNHQLFKKTHDLSFPLLADVKGEVAKAFGVPTRSGGEITRVVNGKQQKLVRGVTARRWTYVIGLDGRIISRNTDVQPGSDGRVVLDVVRQLATSNP